MKKAMKVLGILLCAVLLVVGSVAATLAYLTSKATVTNTFAVGDVEITLTEAEVNEDGQPTINGSTTYEEDGEIKDVTIDNADRVTSNNYHFMPTVASYTKDPTVTVKAGSDASYVRLMVKMEGITWAQFVNSTDFSKTGSSYWECQNPTAELDGGVATYEFRYIAGAIGATDEDVPLEALFTAINGTQAEGADENNYSYSALDNLTKITIEAHAIQSEGFADQDAAWTAFASEETTAFTRS